MPLSGPISMSQLATEFGFGNQLGGYVTSAHPSEPGLYGVNKCALSSFYGRRLGGYEQWSPGAGVNFVVPTLTYIDGAAIYYYCAGGGGGGGGWYSGLAMPGGGGGSGGFYWPIAVTTHVLGQVVGPTVGGGGAPGADGGSTVVLLNGGAWMQFNPGLKGGGGYFEGGVGGAGGYPNGNAGQSAPQVAFGPGGEGGAGPGGAFPNTGGGGHGGGNGNAGLTEGAAGCFAVRWSNS